MGFSRYTAPSHCKTVASCFDFHNRSIRTCCGAVSQNVKMVPERHTEDLRPFAVYTAILSSCPLVTNMFLLENNILLVHVFCKLHHVLCRRTILGHSAAKIRHCTFELFVSEMVIFCPNSSSFSSFLFKAYCIECSLLKYHRLCLCLTCESMFHLPAGMCGSVGMFVCA